MSQFSYSFCLSLFHSLWQSALLLLLYFAIQPVVKKQLPSFKRNVLYALLFSQVIISCCTFFIYYYSSFNFYKDLLDSNLSMLAIEPLLIEKYTPWIVSAYTIVISFKTIHLLYNWYRFKRLCNTTLIKPSIDLKLFTAQKANEFGIHRKVTLWFSQAVSTPLTFGFLKPVILMPVALLNHLSIAETESLIIHELTHIKNNDYILNWLLVIAETIFFFNPFIRIIANKIKLEREKNCDVQVLQFKYPVISYAETLLKTARFKTNINFFPLAAVFKNKQLLQRIRFFTADTNLVFSKKKHTSISFSAIAIALVVNLFILIQLQDKKPTEDAGTLLTPLASQHIPSFDSEIPKAIAVANSFAKNISTKELEEQVASVRQNLKKINLDAKLMAEKSLQLAEKELKELQVDFVIPVVNMEEPEEQEVVVKEESSGTNLSVTKTYKIKLKNGKWKNELVSVIKERTPKPDSICVEKGAVISYIPVMQ